MYLLVLEPAYTRHSLVNKFYIGGNQRWSSRREDALVFTSYINANTKLHLCAKEDPGAAARLHIEEV